MNEATKKAWKISFRKVLHDTAVALKTNPEAPLGELEAIAREWVSASTGPHEEKLMFQVGLPYSWFQNYVPMYIYGEPYDEEEFFSEERRKSDGPAAVESLRGIDALMVKALQALRNEDGTPLFGVALGRIERYQMGSASGRDSLDDDGLRPGMEIADCHLEMGTVKPTATLFTFSWADGTKDGDLETVSQQTVPFNADQAEDWMMNVSTGKKKTRVVKAAVTEITEKWFPERPNSVRVDAIMNSKGWAKGMYEHTHACPVFVVWPSSLSDQVYKGKQVTSA